MKSDEETAASLAIIALMKGVVYRETHETPWAALGRHLGAVRDHFEVIGVEVVVDEVEGYAYLRSGEEEVTGLPRLVHRRSLSYPVSLLLVLLRKRLVELESTTSETRLVMTKAQLVSMMEVFLPDSSNEARLLDQLEANIKKVVELGFLRPLKGEADTWEVRRILKAYVDAQTLAEFDAKLADYRGLLEAEDG